VHRRMRQLSLTETETFVNLAKHALETLSASDEEDNSKDLTLLPAHYRSLQLLTAVCFCLHAL